VLLHGSRPVVARLRGLVVVIRSYGVNGNSRIMRIYFRSTDGQTMWLEDNGRRDASDRSRENSALALFRWPMAMTRRARTARSSLGKRTTIIFHADRGLSSGHPQNYTCTPSGHCTRSLKTHSRDIPRQCAQEIRRSSRLNSPVHENSTEWDIKVDVLVIVSLTSFAPFAFDSRSSYHTSPMRFSTLVAFLLPLSALAAPSLIRRDAVAFNKLSKGISDAIFAFGAILATSAEREPAEQSIALNTGTQAFTSLSGLYSGPAIARVGNAVQEGRQPSNDEYVDTLSPVIITNTALRLRLFLQHNSDLKHPRIRLRHRRPSSGLHLRPGIRILRQYPGGKSCALISSLWLERPALIFS